MSARIVLTVFAVLLTSQTAWAKAGSTVYTDRRQANARAHAGEPWSDYPSHAGYMQEWLDRSLADVRALVPHASLPRAKAPAWSGLCPNGKPLRGWYVNPDWHRFKVKCMDTDDGTPDLWYPENDFDAHYTENRASDGAYQYPPADTTFCDPANPHHDCGYGATYDGRRYYFVAYYVYTLIKNMTRLDLGNPLDGRSLAWSGAMLSVFDGSDRGRQAALRVAVLLDALAESFGGSDGWYEEHLRREPGLGGFLDGGQGVWLGRMSDGIALFNLIRAYDIVYRFFDDAELQGFAGATAAELRLRIERDLFFAAVPLVRTKLIWGNATLPHDLMLHLALVLDAGADSQAMLDWVFSPQGGRLPEMFFNSIDRDGGSDEVAATYVSYGYEYHLDTGQTLELYARNQFALSGSYSIAFREWRRMRFRLARHFAYMRNLETIPDFYVHLGDDGRTGRAERLPLPTADHLTVAYERFGPDPDLAVQAREANGGTIHGLHTSVWDDDPYAVQRSLTRDLRKEPLVPPLRENLPGFGFAQLRSGPAASEHSVWGYFGRSQSPLRGFGNHAHHDQLDFGIQYAGLDFMPTLGSPSGYGWRYFGWESHTASHNTLIVDRTRQSHSIWASDIKTFFDTPGSPVALFELESRTAYPGVYEWPAMLPDAKLRRTVFRIETGNGKFFVVEVSSAFGGGTHHYSYHGGGDTIVPQGISLSTQAQTYAGADAGYPVAYESGYDFDEVDAACRADRACVEAYAWLYRGSGFQFLADADYTATVPATFRVQWNQFDWSQRTASNATLTLWTIPVGVFDQAATANGRMPAGETVRYLILRGQNGAAGSALVNVWEPSLDTPQIAEVIPLHASIAGGMVLSAVEIRLADGRTYHVGIDEAGTQVPRSFGPLSWTGRFAVHGSAANGARLFGWIGEGSALAFGGQSILANRIPAYVGEVSQVQESDGASSFRARMNVDPALVSGRWADIEVPLGLYTDYRDSTYLIESASTKGPNAEFRVGKVPLIAGVADYADYNAGFRYHINVGERFRVALDWWE